MLSNEHINRLAPCSATCEYYGDPCQSREVLRWLNQHATAYPTGHFIPPLTPLVKGDDPTHFGTFAVTMRQANIHGSGARIKSIEYSSDVNTTLSSNGSDAEIINFLTTTMLHWKTSGMLLISSGMGRNVLDIFLEQFGRLLVAEGYTLQPFLGDGGVGFLKVRKNKRTWTLCYAEKVSGVETDTLLGYARDVESLSGASFDSPSSSTLYSVIDVYQRFLLETFGVAIRPTVGMIALRCARRFMPKELKKWRPPPLLVCMERIGRGYRGGMTYARRYRGPATRIDVVRQYTATLADQLPYRSCFGRYDPESDKPGIFLCHVRLANTITYPLGVWSGEDHGFVAEACSGGTYLSILHTSEFPGLLANGAYIRPYYGFTFDDNFTLAPFVERIQSILDTYGRESNIAKITKPLGNQVYGKFAQRPDTKELMYSDTWPGGDWFPYVDGNLNEWPVAWERQSTRYTSSQQVDIAGHITGAARSQTISMWSQLSEWGLDVIRCHTDSLTFIGEMPPELSSALSEDSIGAWRIESEEPDTVIVGPNAFIDEHGPHIAGVSSPTWEMIERLYDGEIAYVWQEQKTPLRGFTRERRYIKRELNA